MDPIHHKHESRDHHTAHIVVVAVAVIFVLTIVKMFFGVWAGVGVAISILVGSLLLLWRLL